MNKGWIGIAALSALGLVMAGCAPKAKPVPVTTRPAVTLQEKIEQQTSQLKMAVKKFQNQANALPGATDMAHRKIMRAAFDDLAKALPILAGANPSGAFRLQIRSIQSASQQLTSNPALAPEPIEDAGLRAAVAAIERISHEDFYANSPARHMIDQLRVSLRPLDRTTGPLHRLAVRDVVRQMASAVQVLADTYIDRVGANQHPHERQPAATTQP